MKKCDRLYWRAWRRNIGRQGKTVWRGGRGRLAKKDGTDFIPLDDDEAQIVRLMSQGHDASCIHEHMGTRPESVRETLYRLAKRLEAARAAVDQQS
jgi:hypothetical protein